MGNQKKYCSFRVGSARLGIEVENVRETLVGAELTPVPLTPSVVEGMLNLRGQIVTVMSLRKLMKTEYETPPTKNVFIIVDVGTDSMAFLVDAVDDVIEVDEDMYEPPPKTLSAFGKELILGAYKLEKELMLILDIKTASRI